MVIHYIVCLISPAAAKEVANMGYTPQEAEKD